MGVNDGGAATLPETDLPPQTVPRQAKRRRITGRKPKRNPIDPETGQRKVGRPRRETRDGPIDSMMGPQPTEMSGQESVRIAHLDPKEAISSPEAEEYYKRLRRREPMGIPQAIRNKYPDGHFAWARNTPESISEYRDGMDFELVEANPATTGRADTLLVYRDAVLMVQPKWMADVRQFVHRESVLESLGRPRGDAESEEEPSDVRGVRLFTEERTTRATAPPSEQEERETERAAAKRAYARNPNRPKGSVGRGSKYVSGGFPT